VVKSFDKPSLLILLVAEFKKTAAFIYVKILGEQRLKKREKRKRRLKYLSSKQNEVTLTLRELVMHLLL